MCLQIKDKINSVLKYTKVILKDLEFIYFHPHYIVTHHSDLKHKSLPNL